MSQEDELKAYLSDLQLNDLIKDMTGALATTQPDEPIGFLIKFLSEKYADKAASAVIPSGRSSPIMGASSSLAQLVANAEEESDEDDDFMEEDPNAPVYEAPKNFKKGTRKSGISAESLDPSKMKEQMKNLVVIPKEDAVKEELLRVVGKSALLKMLDQEQKDKIVDAFSGPVLHNEGDNIIVQGELGDVFFLLEEGAVDVYIKKGDMPEEMKVHTYKPGDAFGELAIMYNAPRAATCRAASSCKLWSLDRTSFKVIVVAAAMLKREMYQGFLEKVPILETCNPGEIQTLADSLAEETYVDGSVICEQGAEGNYFYIIKEGTAKCYVGDKEVAALNTGNYFGEVALMTNKARQATVKAEGELKVLALDRATFTRVLGNMEDIMKRNMEKYKEFVMGEL
jgi:cAMP-dependent protein kinase regulator